ncbi:hypothetical protein [Aequitasia blattaphilus]|uniref:Uncharacterized protein n=2 Tax=Aequitasia blattaphilus TaxID=2949332 RepID=A0ABT1E848_9FIRM|nr:hypothetical protein [Aequitasia blattaphilus]MCP1102001.1 hypothetical protein [Aequitasia blattaphilus]MCR8614641.1 hypothetical protein [Aequitasia blattaphilus]
MKKVIAGLLVATLCVSPIQTLANESGKDEVDIVQDEVQINEDAKDDAAVEEEINEKGEGAKKSEIEKNIITKDDCTPVNGIESPYEIVDSNSVTRASTIAGRWILDSNGRWWYRHNDGSYTVNGWEYINGNWFYFDSVGYMVTDWLLNGGYWYYLDLTTGAMVRGWRQIGSNWYFFNASGQMHTGWHDEGGYRYYLKPSTGAMARGWLQVGSNWYFFNASGQMHKGWHDESGHRYYLKPGTGVMAKGWCQVGTRWYFFNVSGQMQKGWHSENGLWYYLNGDGVMLTGWQHLKFSGMHKNEPFWHFFDSSGRWKTDSDALGCGHGLNTFRDFRFASNPSFSFYSTCNSTVTGRIRTGAQSWNNAVGRTIFREGVPRDSNDIAFVPGTLDEYTLAVTYVGRAVGWHGPSSFGKNWYSSKIICDTNKSIPASTMAHEFGHALGLSHRISTKNTIMCQLGNGRTVSSPQAMDVTLFNHLGY